MRAGKHIDVSQEKKASEPSVRTDRSFYVLVLHYNPQCSSLLQYFLTLPFAMIMRDPHAVVKKHPCVIHMLLAISVLAWSQTARAQNRLRTAILLEGRATTSHIPCLSTERNRTLLSWQ